MFSRESAFGFVKLITCCFFKIKREKEGGEMLKETILELKEQRKQIEAQKADISFEDGEEDFETF